jgi:sigma-B regulation protein RsbU (phosphoserine phosphatase)
MPNDFSREQDRLKQALDELAALNQIANAINVLMAVEEITQVIIDHCVRRVKASQGAIFLLGDKDKQIDHFKTFIREYSPTTDKIPFHLNESLAGWMLKNRTIFISNDPDRDERFKGMNLSKQGINSILSAPLLSRSGLIGSLIMINKRESEGFTPDDMRFLGIVGTQAAKVIENAHLREEEQQLVLIREEIKLARSIQQHFLPGSSVSLPTCDVCGLNVPAKEIGGDFFDIVQLDEKRVFLSLGDVSGKGIPASLLMANAQAVLRSQLFKAGEAKLTDLADSLNNLICQFTGPEQFITSIIGEFDCASGTFRYINSGHLPPMIVKRNGGIDILSASDLVIGVVPEYQYAINDVLLEKGDMLCLYSDGITELFNERDEEFGAKGLEELLRKYHGEHVSSCCRNIIQDLNDYRGDCIQSDDITIVMLGVRN